VVSVPKKRMVKGSAAMAEAESSVHPLAGATAVPMATSSHIAGIVVSAYAEALMSGDEVAVSEKGPPDMSVTDDTETSTLRGASALLSTFSVASPPSIVTVAELARQLVAAQLVSVRMRGRQVPPEVGTARRAMRVAAGTSRL
jgi:hypothetical protein